MLITNSRNYIRYIPVANKQQKLQTEKEEIKLFISRHVLCNIVCRKSEIAGIKPELMITARLQHMN